MPYFCPNSLLRQGKFECDEASRRRYCCCKQKMSKSPIRGKPEDEESKRILSFYVVFCFVIYFIWCDWNFFGELAAEREYVNNNEITSVTIKLRTQDHFGHYVYLPVATWINETFRISKIPFVTANVVTVMHFVLAILCGRLAASQKLFVRRAAVILYSIRTMLDALDGVVYRAQSSTKEFNQGWRTYGYLIDAAADTFGGIFLLLGTLYRFNKNPPIKNPEVGKGKQDREDKEQLLLSEDSCSEESNKYYGVKRYSKLCVYSTAVIFGFVMFLRSFLWDYYNHEYYNLLAVKGQNPVS